MPLRDHFHPPFSRQLPWDGFHGQWPAMLVLALKRFLPPNFSAMPSVHLGSGIEVDIGTFQKEIERINREEGPSAGGSHAALLAPPAPNVSVELKIPIADEYEVRIYDKDRDRKLVAAIEIVSPSNKDRPEHRREFVAKCASLLRQDVSVSIVDIVTARNFNLYLDLLDFFGQSDRQFSRADRSIYAATCAVRNDGTQWSLKSWAFPLSVGERLPTIPLILSDWLGVNLDLEAPYEATLDAVS